MKQAATVPISEQLLPLIIAISKRGHLREGIDTANRGAVRVDEIEIANVCVCMRVFISKHVCSCVCTCMCMSL
jgi:hypothetical protein